MPIARIHRCEQDALYFVTPTVWNWYYIFDRHNRWQILADSLLFLQNNKQLEIHAYVFMLNHIHLIIQAPDVISVLQDFKRHTTKYIKKNIQQTEQNLLPLFCNNSDQSQIWKTDNQPKIINTQQFYLQKLNYIHNNPVLKGYVEQPEFWKWSSANPNSKIKTVAEF